jgi:hypothetical protein
MDRKIPIIVGAMILLGMSGMTIAGANNDTPSSTEHTAKSCNVPISIESDYPGPVTVTIIEWPEKADEHEKETILKQTYDRKDQINLENLLTNNEVYKIRIQVEEKPKLGTTFKHFPPRPSQIRITNNGDVLLMYCPPYQHQ